MSETITPEKRFDDESGKDGLGQSLGIVRTLYMDKEAGRAAIEVKAEMRMCHSGGVVQGGFVTGWIDAAMARAAMCVTDFEMTPMSLEIKISFFRPATPGLLVAEGWIERRGRSTMFVEGNLKNAEGEIVAKGTSTVRMMPLIDMSKKK
ncbi:PaaI family thioesterase [Parvibaculum sp.]|jgi:acyl-CoA thioesterase|uniref:PaaI family thioesterase n=1 Tax=Parvibaculum sp. TaxID=2024848 RepID=UPI000C357526|nr:PaaI family thioesterase [Parvibaculum sp.]MAM93166.1 thioesterase [Parvibaculum sp.]HCX69357.1 PaaI family thioesterase [Rhodobiaceae bacterium]|tara:strand:- start:21283 stop:21729 length:447 start_codon:yes stop_codon:yes gene_type:complete